MVNTDRDDFDAQLSELFGAYPQVILGKDRREAYWRGLQAMSLPMFTRVVDKCLSAGGDEKPPSVYRIWEISNALKSRMLTRPPEVQALERLEATISPFQRISNVALLKFIVSIKPEISLPHGTLELLSDERARVLADFECLATEVDVTEDEFRRALKAAFDRQLFKALNPTTQEETEVCE